MEIEEDSFPAPTQESIYIMKDASLIISDSCYSKGFCVGYVECVGCRGLHATILRCVEGPGQMIWAPMV